MSKELKKIFCKFGQEASCARKMMRCDEIVHMYIEETSKKSDAVERRLLDEF